MAIALIGCEYGRQLNAQTVAIYFRYRPGAAVWGDFGVSEHLPEAADASHKSDNAC
jgi:hypothetical protein